MSELSPRDRALVGLGAALASNCIPCVEHQIPAARAAGLSDEEIRAALGIADTIRQVPARRVLARAQEVVDVPAVAGAAAPVCSQLDKKPVEQTLDAMSSTMSKMMSTASACAPAKPTSGGCC